MLDALYLAFREEVCIVDVPYPWVLLIEDLFVVQPLVFLDRFVDHGLL